jgi:serine protease AprX
MKQGLFVLIFISAFTRLCFSQTDSSNLYYWVKLKDKNHNQCSLNNPQQFLSAASINRRSSQNLAIDSSDLPITQLYIDSIAPYINGLVHRLKWFNIIVVHITNASNVDSVKRFDFVDSIAPITYFPYKKLQLTGKFESVGPVNQSITYPDVHGAAYRQINMLNGDLLHQLGYKGQGIIIAMMDNGLLDANLMHAFDSVRPRILATWDFVHNSPNVYADPLGGHATETFSCIAANLPNKFVGTAPGASFVLMQTEDNNAEWVMEEYNWAAGAEFADSVGAQIFSSSLGYTQFDNNLGNNTYADLNGNKTVCTQAANIATSKGIVIFNSIGNYGQDSWHYLAAPADADSILAVGAVDSTGDSAAFSSWGPNSVGRIKPDICAQGFPASVMIANSNDYIGKSDGTSFSCPIAAGCAASLWSAFPGKTARDIQTAIVISANRFWNPDNKYGYGIPNFYNAYLLLKTGYNANVLKISNDVTLYPNPFSSQLNVSLYSDTAENHTIEIFDVTGRKVFFRQFFIRDKTFEILTIDELAGLAAGEYILSYDGKKEYSHKIMKVR